MPKYRLDSNEIIKQYEIGHTQYQIAQMYQTTRHQIQKILKASDVNIRNSGHKITQEAKDLLSNPQKLEFLHWNEKLSLDAIRRIVGLKSTGAIVRSMKKYKIPYRMSHQEHLSKEQVEFRKNPQNFVNLNQNYTLPEIAKLTGYSKGHVSNIISYTGNKAKIHKTEQSYWEKNIANHISKFTEVICNDRQIIQPLELDIVIPKYKIAIECNGIYWHSSNHIPPNYHLNKTIECRKAGYSLYHLNCYQYRQNENKVIKFVENLIVKGEYVYARKCDIGLQNNEFSKQFYYDYHLQGSPSLDKNYVNVSLEQNDEIIALMSFSKCRFNKKYEWELVRYATSKRVVGGASKLLNYFIKQFEPKTIISYAEIAVSHGNLYHKLGFTHLYNTIPDYKYIVGTNLVHRQQFQKKKIREKFPDNFDENKTEEQILSDLGIYRYYGCGNMVFLLDLT